MTPGEVTVGRLVAGRYELLWRCGRGGMAEVYVARDRVLSRPVAVKILHDGLAPSDSVLARFRREAQQAAGLNHPNIVAVHDTGQEDHRPFIVMELIDGPSLAEALSGGPLAEQRALAICADVCAALGHAHERGLVHRDVKPGNILLARDGSAKVADFGIVRIVGVETLTGTSVFGTATYLAPEQAQGGEVDARTDLYALGVVLYEMLAGRPPFVGPSPLAVVVQHVEGAVLPPRLENPAVSRAAEAIVLRALAKDPAGRFASAEEMRVAVLRALDAARAAPKPGGVAAPSAAPGGARLATARLDPETAPTVAISGAEAPFVAAPNPTRRWFLRYAVLGLLALLGLLTAARAGATGVLVPSLVGLPLSAAEAELAVAGLGLVADYAEVGGVDPGTVVDQAPPQGSRMTNGADVRVLVAVAPPPPPPTGTTDADEGAGDGERGGDEDDEDDKDDGGPPPGRGRGRGGGGG